MCVLPPESRFWLYHSVTLEAEASTFVSTRVNSGIITNPNGFLASYIMIKCND